MPGFFLPEKVVSKLTDIAIDNLNKYLPNKQLRDLIETFHSEAGLRTALKKSIERAIQRFNDQYTDHELANILIKEKFWELPAVQEILRTVITRPSSYLEFERTQFIQTFTGVFPEISSEKMQEALHFFIYCLSDEVLNISQLTPIYAVQMQKAAFNQNQQLLEEVKGLRSDNQLFIKNLPSEQSLAALPSVLVRVYPKNNLPRPDYSLFVGREQEKAKIIERLSPLKHGGVITIDGVGGVGKSALALEVAYYYLNNYQVLPEAERFEAIIWTSAKQKVLTITGVRSRPQVLRNLEDIYTAISVTLGREDIIRAKPEEQAILVTTALSERRTLLIVDNLETIDDENLLGFLQELPLNAKAIVTTRHRIDVAYPVRLTGLSEREALTLIESECKEKDVHIDINDARDLYKRTGGLPLAIVLSVGQIIYGYSIKTVLAKLGSAKSDIIKFCFETSLEIIQSDSIENRGAYKLLLALSLFSKDASRETLGYVADYGEDELSRDDALVVLEKLSLVNKSNNRFNLLPLTKIFVTAELEKDKELQPILYQNWESYFLRFFDSRDLTYDEMSRFEIEIPNFLGFMDWCAVNDKTESLVTFLLNNTTVLWFRGYWTERWFYLKLAYDKLSAATANREILAKLAERLAEMSKYRGETIFAKNLLLQALSIFEESKNFKYVRRISRDLAGLYKDIGDIEQARIYINKAYKAATLDDRPEFRKARLKVIHAQIEMIAGNYDLATLLLKESILYQEGTLDYESNNVTNAYTFLAKIEIIKGDYTTAQSRLERALELANITQIKPNIAFVTQTFALLNESSNKKVEALEYAYAALSLYKELGIKLRIRETEEIIDRCEKMR